MFFNFSRARQIILFDYIVLNSYKLQWVWIVICHFKLQNESSVDNLLISLGLEKYSITFKAEEVRLYKPLICNVCISKHFPSLIIDDDGD